MRALEQEYASMPWSSEAGSLASSMLAASSSPLISVSDRRSLEEEDLIVAEVSGLNEGGVAGRLDDSLKPAEYVGDGGHRWRTGPWTLRRSVVEAVGAISALGGGGYFFGVMVALPKQESGGVIGGDSVAETPGLEPRSDAACPGACGFKPLSAPLPPVPCCVKPPLPCCAESPLVFP